MFKNMALWKKMTVVGVASVMALSILYGGVWWSVDVVDSATEARNVREQQLGIVRGMEGARLELVLAAMDSIIDKGAGKIDDERMVLINTDPSFLLDNLSTLADLADTGEEKQLAGDIATDVEALVQVLSLGDFQSHNQLPFLGQPIDRKPRRIWPAVLHRLKHPRDVTTDPVRTVAVAVDDPGDSAHGCFLVSRVRRF